MSKGKVYVYAGARKESKTRPGSTRHSQLDKSKAEKEGPTDRPSTENSVAVGKGQCYVPLSSLPGNLESLRGEDYRTKGKVDQGLRAARPSLRARYT